MNPILIEDFPSLDKSSRTACLDLVESSDIYLVVIGDRPGSSPLGKAVVEEEFDEARKRKIPRLLFIQNTSRDEETDALVYRLSDFVNGRFRTTFETPEDLQVTILAALKALPNFSMNQNQHSLIDQLLDSRTDGNTVVLRLALVPERQDEVWDVLDFDRDEFRRSIFQLAHGDAVRLFDFEQGPNRSEVNSSCAKRTA